MLLDYLVVLDLHIFCFISGNFTIRTYEFLSNSVSLIKLACFNLAAKFYSVNLLNSWVVIYLEWSGILFSTVLATK